MNLVDRLSERLSRLFGVHRTKRIKGWADISVGQFLELQKAGEGLTLADGLRIVYGVELNELPVSEISKYSLSFLKSEPKREGIRKVYELGGHRYAACFDTTRLTTAQFVDFQNYAKADDFVGVLSVCMRPEGREYNDGYSLEQVRADIAAFMPITQALTVAFFFKNQLQILLQAIHSSSVEEMKRDPQMRGIADILERVDLQSLGYYQ